MVRSLRVAKVAPNPSVKGTACAYVQPAHYLER